MKLKILAPLFFFSVNAFAVEPDWLNPYLRSKAIRCDMTQAQLNNQVATHIDFNIQKLTENLKARGSAIESVLHQRDQVEIGIFPKATTFDLSVFTKVTVVIQNWHFSVQTTYATENSATPSVEKGLWFPLAIVDSGPGTPCTLSRIGYKEDGRKFVPVVDLVFGGPPRVVASDIVQVMDPEGAIQNPAALAKPENKKKLSEEPPPDPTSKAKDLKDSEPEKPTVRSSHRRHRHRISRRSSSRRHIRHRLRHRRSEDSAVQTSQKPPPEKPSECTGDDSPWRTAACKLGILK